MKKWKVFLLIMIAIAVLQFPMIGPLFQAANTLVHESGHALSALLTNGNVRHIHLFSNTEGMTLASVSNQWGQVITALAGYIFASFFAFVLGWLWHKGRARLAAGLLLTLSLINLIFWVKNMYGIVWVVGFSLFLTWLISTKSAAWREYGSFVLFVIMVIDSVRSAFTVTLISLLTPDQAGDAYILELTTFAPAAIWGILFFVQSLFFGGLAAIFLLSARRQSPAART